MILEPLVSSVDVTLVHWPLQLLLLCCLTAHAELANNIFILLFREWRLENRHHLFNLNQRQINVNSSNMDTWSFKTNGKKKL